MQKPQLVIMAAGLGSRFGGLKQMAAVDPQGHWIIDYSIYDAVQAGFGRIILIVKPENEQLFRDTLGARVGQQAEIVYVHQTPDALPEGFSIPEGRVKPWGTGHAVLCAKDAITAPFAVINADDFYGRKAYAAIHDFLVSDHPNNEFAMVGYQVENTLTENGYVARGVCAMDESGEYLTGIVERTHIEPRPGGAAYTDDDGKTYTFLPNGTIVSMNVWGFTPAILPEIEERFAGFLRIFRIQLLRRWRNEYSDRFSDLSDCFSFMLLPIILPLSDIIIIRLQNTLSHSRRILVEAGKYIQHRFSAKTEAKLRIEIPENRKKNGKSKYNRSHHIKQHSIA